MKKSFFLFCLALVGSFSVHAQTKQLPATVKVEFIAQNTDLISFEVNAHEKGAYFTRDGIKYSVHDNLEEAKRFLLNADYIKLTTLAINTDKIFLISESGNDKPYSLMLNKAQTYSIVK